MIQNLDKILDELVKNITPGQFEGVMLYVLGAISSTIVKLHFRKDWSIGMKGDNGRWESPEIMLTILFIIIDHLFMADAFLGKVMSDGAWLGIGFLFLYGFTGRWGLEWLSTIKGTTIIKTSKEERTTVTEKEQAKKPAQDSGSGDDVAG